MNQISTNINYCSSDYANCGESDLSFIRLKNAEERIKQQSIFFCREIGSEILRSPVFPRHREEVSSFGYSLRSFLLYAQIGNGEIRSPGLFLERGDTSFALGLFLRYERISAHIVSPHGESWQQVVAEFSTWLKRNNIVDLVYVRQMKIEEALKLESYDFRVLDTFNGWCSGAPLEDETFNHRLVSLKSIVEYEAVKGLMIKNLEGVESNSFSKKFRMAYQRGKNFLSKNNLTYTLRQFTANDLPEVKKLICDHFDVLEQSGKAVGSCALDYELLLQNLLNDNARYASLVGVLQLDGRELIVSVFLAERTGACSGGLYCSITSRCENHLRTIAPNLDSTGFTALSQFSYATLFGELLNRGWESVDLGGSETSDLDRFKRQMNAKLFETTWRVM